MAKIVKRKKPNRSIFDTFNTFCCILFTIAVAARLFTSIVIGSMNNETNISIQEARNKAESLRVENQKLSIEIQTLQNKERIYTIAQDAGLAQQNNIVSIAGGSSEAEYSGTSLCLFHTYSFFHCGSGECFCRKHFSNSFKIKYLIERLYKKCFSSNRYCSF